MFKTTKRFVRGSGLVNQVDIKKFNKFLPFILEKQIQSIQKSSTPSVSTTASNDSDEKSISSSLLLSAQEQDQISKLFQFSNAEELSLIIDFCSYIFEQALYFNANPDKLFSQLLDIGLEEIKADTFRETWTQLGRNFISVNKNRTLGGPLELETVDWQLQLKLSESDLSRQKTPSALFSFSFSNQETLQLEFSKTELYQFFLHLETIQSQLDETTANQ